MTKQVFFIGFILIGLGTGFGQAQEVKTPEALAELPNSPAQLDFAMRSFPHNQPDVGTAKFFLSSDHLKDEIWLDDRLWKYHPGNNEAWALPEFDDRSWELVEPALGPNEPPRSGWQGVGWSRNSAESVHQSVMKKVTLS